MHPHLGLLKPYPFEKLRALLAGAAPPAQEIATAIRENVKP